MDRFINEQVHRELIRCKDPLAVAEALKMKDGRHLAEEFLEDLLPLPFASAESSSEDLAYLLMQKLLFPYL